MLKNSKLFVNSLFLLSKQKKIQFFFKVDTLYTFNYLSRLPITNLNLFWKIKWHFPVIPFSLYQWDYFWVIFEPLNESFVSFKVNGEKRRQNRKVFMMILFVIESSHHLILYLTNENHVLMTLLKSYILLTCAMINF